MKTLPILLTVVGITSSLNAAVVGYWRFEDSAFLSDSGPNGFTLSTAATAPTQVAAPSAYPGTVGGSANGSAASFGGNGRFTEPDNALFTDTSFTVEALVTTTTDTGGTRVIAGHWNSSGDQRGWLVGISATNGLVFQYSSSGANSVAISSGITLSANTAYYIAVAVNMADTSANGITFYFQDLTNGGAFGTASNSPQHTSFLDSSAAFTIGATAGGTSPWTGTIDEVRISDEKLGVSQLLIPEPASMLLASLGMGIVGLRRRR